MSLRGLTKRILFIALTSGFIVMVLTVSVVRFLVDEATTDWMGLACNHFRTHAPEMAACAEDAAHWRTNIGGAEIDGFDGATGQSPRAGEPALDRNLLGRLAQGESCPVEIAVNGPWGGIAAFRLADRGPCGIVRVRWPLPPSLSRWGRGLPFLCVFVVAGLLISILVVRAFRPVLRRLAQLERLTAQVGSREGFSLGEAGADELGSLARRLEEAHQRIRSDAERLEHERRTSERFLIDVAHDLRTPIASLQIVLEELAAIAGSPEAQPLLRSALSDVVYVGSLVANLRMANQLKDGMVPATARTDLAAVVESVAVRERVFARHKGIVFDVARPDSAVLVRCDSTMAERAIANLVENAITYSDPGSRVTLALSNGAGGFRLVVSDEGPGVPPVDLPRLGERTFRSDSARRRDPHGGGIGLAIVSEVCARNGWQCSFAANEPRGLQAIIVGAVSDTSS